MIKVKQINIMYYNIINLCRVYFVALSKFLFVLLLFPRNCSFQSVKSENRLKLGQCNVLNQSDRE